VGQTNNYNLRNSRNFTIPPGRLGFYQSSFFPSSIRLWNNRPTDLRNYSCQQMFKNELRKMHNMSDKPPLYFSTCIRIANIVHVRLRQKYSSLKCDLLRCNVMASYNCDCGRVWRYQKGNQNPYIKEEQTTQWPKENIQKDKQRSTKHTYKSKDRVKKLHRECRPFLFNI
jgi:hypothetical protein